METITESHYKGDRKRDFTPEELARAKTACEFVIDLTKAISRSGYYDSNHPVSREVKRGLYDFFKATLGNSSEIMLTCHEFEEKYDIHISGILDEPFNIRKMAYSDILDLYIPKLKDYFERKSLNSFVIKKQITSEHFESFIDVMSEPVADLADYSKLGDYLTKSLVDLGINEVTTIFKDDIVLPRGKLPWRVSIILRRLAKDLKVIPMFRLASDDKIKQMKIQIIDDVIRPLNSPDLLGDLIVNGDVIINYLGQALEANELEKMIVDSLPAGTVVPVAEAVFDVYDVGTNELQLNQNDTILQQRCKYLSTVLNLLARRIDSELLPDATGLFEKLYEREIIAFDMLPEKLQLNIKCKKLAVEIISQKDQYIDKILKASSMEDMETGVATFRTIVPVLIRMKEWSVINQIVKALYSSPFQTDGYLNANLNLPDSVFEGSEEAFVEEYINGEAPIRDEMNEILSKMTFMCIKILEAVFDKCKDPVILKGATDLLSRKVDLAKQWSVKILDGKNQSLNMLNIALLVIMNIGQTDDISLIKKHTKNMNPSIRTKALDVAIKLNKKDAEALIIEALTDEDEKVRNHAATIIERDSSLSAELFNQLCLFIKTRLAQKQDITMYEAKFLARLIKTIERAADIPKGHWENEVLSITTDLVKGRVGFLKYKSAPDKEHLEVIYACLSTLGKIGGHKSITLLNTFLRDGTSLSKVASETVKKLKEKIV
ncbi:hypothetical protein ASZ90_007672 [hydrocarbon metagenome]|uniref:HEAT repeat domain-containing protein n=1 Tax=hydrocarbon metagenome TaxID=938273 RepID=A0A0W8FP13_9ZZZZ